MVVSRIVPRERPLVPFWSILFRANANGEELEGAVEPGYFSDLNLDQIIDAITAGREEYVLKPIFYQRIRDVDTLHYRQEVLRDLEGAAVAEQVNAFASSMREMREHLTLARKLRYQLQQRSWFLEAVSIYCDAVRSFSLGLGQAKATSRGLLAFQDYLTTYLDSADFMALFAETAHVKQGLSEVRYLLHIKGNKVRVGKLDLEGDYSVEVENTFERFKETASKDYRSTFSEWPEVNPVEATILDLVARLFSNTFAELSDFCTRQVTYLDQTIERFDREVQFYLAYLAYIDQFKSSGLRFCYPDISTRSKEVFASNTFDLALAGKLVPEGSPVVCNDFELKGAERIFVVSGPNQGGKTTFARTFGQLHHLACVGYPVPGSGARLFLFDQLFTHFERHEDPNDLRGKLEDDLVRLRAVFNAATAESLVIMNEVFTSTTLTDARFLGRKVIEKVMELGLLCVYVTFVEELASLGSSIVSMVSTISADNPAHRTFRVVRSPGDGLAYAMAIAELHGLTYDRLKGRMAK